MSELALLRWLHRRVSQRKLSRIVVDSGDDCAVVRVGGQLVVLKVDAVVEGVHFAPRTPWRKVGQKAMARPLSDLAAMGAVPSFALVTLSLRRSMTMAEARAISLGAWHAPG